MSREYHQLIATKAAPFETEEGGEGLEEKRGLLNGGRAKPHVWRGNAGTHSAIGSLGRDAKRTLGSLRGNVDKVARGSDSAFKRHVKLGKRMSRLEGALGYLNRRAKRNMTRGGISLWDR